jgi:O-antigen ligase
MQSSDFSRPNSVPYGRWAAGVFLLSFPAATMLVRGGTNALLLAASFVGLCWALTGWRTRQGSDAHRAARQSLFGVCLALAGPFFATCVSELYYGKPVLALLDSPSRFLAAIPVLLALRRLPRAALAFSDVSFALGALAALGVILLMPLDWGGGRLGSRFLDPIHFGDVAMLLGVMAGLSIHWWHDDRMPVRVLKLAGLAAGLLVSVLAGSRGAWFALPPVIVLLVLLPSRSGKPLKRLLWLTLAAVLVAGAAYVGSAGVRERFTQLGSDVVQYRQGNEDTSTGIRLQLYRAALYDFSRHPLFGAGPDGFADSMSALTVAGKVTPTAAQFGRGEVHNQLLAYAANYGLIGALAGLALYLAPAFLFWRQRAADDRATRQAARLGLVFIVCFFVFGLTVETFDLKMIASFYAGVIAILAAVVARV